VLGDAVRPPPHEHSFRVALELLLPQLVRDGDAKHSDLRAHDAIRQSVIASPERPLEFVDL
jgi:hypothetical protein